MMKEGNQEDQRQKDANPFLNYAMNKYDLPMMDTLKPENSQQQNSQEDIMPSDNCESFGQ